MNQSMLQFEDEKWQCDKMDFERTRKSCVKLQQTESGPVPDIVLPPWFMGYLLHFHPWV